MEPIDWQEFSNDIIEQLLEDGSNPEAMYGLEHHFVAEDPEVADKAQQNAFLKGWNVSDLEQVETEDEEVLYCFDIDTECPLDEEIIHEEVEAMVAFAEENNLEYDGWGTHFED